METLTRLLAPGSPDYPALLRVVPGPPTLRVRGSLERSDALAVAIVGARQCTPYGVAVAERLASDLAMRGVTVVSGLARGVDTAAHRGALAGGGRTIAVLGSGIDVLYPPENAELAQQIAGHGAVVSQFRDGTPPASRNFPARNRTLAGLALGVVVVEAGERSGALITAGYAADLGREVFAVPGRVVSPASRGAHRLIQDGAKLVQDWSDIVQEFPEPWRSAVDDAQRRDDGGGERPAADSDQGRVLAELKPDEPLHIDHLMVRCGLHPARLSATLVGLELAGLARQLGGQRWVAVATETTRRA